MQVVIADDHELYRAGVALLVQDAFPQARLVQASDLDQVLNWMAASVECDLLLIDLHMPGIESPRNLRAICDALPDTKVVVLSADDTQETVFEALKAGVRGYIFKSSSSGVIKQALRRVVVDGEIYLSEIQRSVRDPHRSALIDKISVQLTERQQAVLQQLLSGKSNKEISLALKIAEGTVKVHLSVIYETLGVHSRAEALAKLAS